MDCPKLEDDGPPAGTSSPLVAAMSTVNLVVGVGILYLPAVFVQCGVIMAIVLSAIVAYSCWYTSQLIVRIGMKIKKYSYEEICQVVLGDFGYIALAVSCIMFNWGAVVSYLLTIKSMGGNVLARALSEVDFIQSNCAWLATPEAIIIILCLPFLWWLSLLKDLSALSFVSIVKAVVVSMTVITIFITSQTASVQDSLHFDRWDKEQLTSFFDDVTDKVEVKGVLVYQKHMNAYLAAIASIPATDRVQRASAAWALVDAVDNEPGWADPLKVRTSLRRLVNRENPKVKEAEYDSKGQLEKVNSETPSFEQPKGIFKRLTHFAPYLFCHQFFLKMGTICFSFVFHDSIFSVYKSLKEPTIPVFRSTSIMFMGFAFVIQVLFGCFIGLTFGTSTPTNVLTSSYSEGAVFPADNILSQIIQIAFSVVLLLTYPACIVICREFVESIIMLYRKPKDIGGQPQEISRITQLIIASILVLLTVPFLFFQDAGEVAEQVLDLVGAFACGLMAFVLPSIVFWKTAVLYPDLNKNLSMTDRIMPYAVLVLGAYTCLVAPILQILELAGFFSVEMPLPPQKLEM